MTEHPKTCFECDGKYNLVVKDFPVKLADGRQIVVPDVEMLVCSECGEDILPPASIKKVEGHVEKNGGYKK